MRLPDWRVPTDKSISHRSVILGGLGSGLSVVHNFLQSQDCLSTLRCMRGLGVAVEEQGDLLRIAGRGWDGLGEPVDILDAGNSGTTMRLLSGVLSGVKGLSCVTGDASLRSRPMARVVEPLRRMGATIWGRQGGRYAPLAVHGGMLGAIEYELPVASAQVKSAILLGALRAEGVTRVKEPEASRDHTERMLAGRGVKVQAEGGWLSVAGGQSVGAAEMKVPGDPSSAAFLGAIALLNAGSELLLKDVLVNPTRIGLFNILRRMGGQVVEHNRRVEDGEPVADLQFVTSGLKGTMVGKAEIPSTIDELPLLAVLASQAEGETRVEGAEELRVKESDRIKGIVTGLRAMG
ncbi:MAG TPA: 3-phosphoshikimate 1-carboxyvinyltransferase, partial [Candidatus Xenobia bacterium]